MHRLDSTACSGCLGVDHFYQALVRRSKRRLVVSDIYRLAKRISVGPFGVGPVFHFLLFLESARRLSFPSRAAFEHGIGTQKRKTLNASRIRSSKDIPPADAPSTLPCLKLSANAHAFDNGSPRKIMQV